ncbi:GGDEF domain-containing protein [Parashewanella spongiae]|uniref:diguanylate cyclase n=1 Tax=Parashewanella spongiae TaxID=342950 RepID=A0A3A6U0F3_9GAMM|nr:GGDEF domain-containing protein [Parashewanella spongiae]MCL1077914.1 GGDEF domain-containing protein [Parashewanella spongiae]RJY17558.1 GGDEF domain-containing protein [Parashewanella spongiae]
MNDSATATVALSALKEQLQTSKRELDQLTLDRNDKFKILQSFIFSLSIACKGHNPELDNKLAKFRRQFDDYESLKNSIADVVDIERLLKNQYHQITISLDNSRTSLTNITNQLLRVTSLPEVVKKELSYFKQDLNKPFHTVWDYVPKLEKLSLFYEQVIELQFNIDSKLDLTPKYQLLAKELLRLISELEFRNEQRDKVSTIQAVLNGEFTADDLLSAYNAIISLLVENLVREKNSAQEFLSALNETLTVVSDLTFTMQNNDAKNQLSKGKLDKKIQGYVGEVESAIRDTNDLDFLKLQVRGQLDQLKTALAHKSEIEQKEKMQLQHSFQNMRNEIGGLSSELEVYKDKLHELQKLNQTDQLTQLPNRAALEDRMSLEYQKLKRKNGNLWVAVADIDYFKSINDKFGHSTGDKALQVIAQVMKNALRDTEFVARYGGEEFVLLLPNVSDNDISPLLERVREKIKSIPFKFKDQRITVTVSIGAAKVHFQEKIEETFDRADAALYRAKDESRDRVIIIS